MPIAILSPYPEEIIRIIEAAGDKCVVRDDISEVGQADFVISYGHRLMIREPYISMYAWRLINLHISYLPWNRGSDPNFWSHIENTPKGVTIHLVDEGLDTGPILAQREVEVSGTLATSYQQLRIAMIQLFSDKWQELRSGNIAQKKQALNSGSYHKSTDKNGIFSRLPLGFDTPLSEVEHLGRQITSRQS